MPTTAVKFPPVACEPALNFPDPADLQTGDILFPRVPRKDGPKNEDELDDKRSRYLERLALSDKELWQEHFDNNRKTWSEGRSQFPSSSTSASGLDISDPANLMLLKKILEASFANEIDNWFGLSMKAFFHHPLMKILLGALNKDLGDGFFIGHCALVLRDPTSTDPADLYVIEANITDYSHYGVSIHPYYIDPSQDGSTAGQMRGWANHRAALGQKVWAQRPVALRMANAEEATQMRQSIVNNAKKYIGRPYGFFDSPRFGDADRLYCSEFISQVFQDTSPRLTVDDRRKWDWLIANIGNAKFGQDVKTAIANADPKIDVNGKDFFILSVHMLWCSANLGWLFSPKNDEHEYAP